MLLFLVCLAVSSVVAIELGDPSSLYQNYVGEYAQTYDDYKPHDYEFGYGVSDPHTGDHKSQWEVKESGVVRGGYSLLEPDGTTRVVEYVADDHGFRALVKKIDQYGNTHVESHGNPEVHHEVAAPVIPPEQVYQTYNGHVDNYVQNVEPIVVGKLAQPLESYPIIVNDNPYPQEQIQSVQQYEEPILQKQFAYAPVVQKQVVYNQAPLPVVQKSYAPTQVLQNEYITSPKQIPQQYYSEQLPVYRQQPEYNQYIAKSPYNLDISAYGPKSEAVYVQPKAPVYQQYDIPQASGYYDQSSLKDYGQNVLTPVAQGLSKEVYPSYLSNDYQHVQPLKTAHPYGESSQNYYASTGNYEDDSAYTRYNDYPISYKGLQQLPLQSVVGHPILH